MAADAAGSLMRDGASLGPRADLEAYEQKVLEWVAL